MPRKQKPTRDKPASYATDFSLSCIETHTSASTDPHRTNRIISNAYKRCMPPNLSESLLPESGPRKLEKEKSRSLESCASSIDPECSCDEASYGDAVFSCFIVAPHVVSVWRGTWGIMELKPTLFPFAQIYLLGIVIHISFAIVRTRLLARSAGAWSKPEGGAISWVRERIITRVYAYIFILSNIMHWRGGWGLLDMVVDKILPDVDDPHRPVLIGGITLFFYIAITVLRSSRNLLASPYFLVTDGKEPTYIFTTRFQISSAGRVIMQLLVVICRRGVPVGVSQARSATHCTDMRGSTAGLADTLASGSRAHAALLECADALFASLVVAPAVVTYWKSTWTLMDLYVLPDDPVGSAAACAAFGLCCDLLFSVFQTQLSKYLRPERGRLTYYIVSRLCTGVAGVACVVVLVCGWVVVFGCVVFLGFTLLSTTAAATLSLAALRALRNICAAPFAVAVDSPQDYFDVPTMFRTNSRETMLYILDCIFSVTVVGSLVVFVWRGSWALLDIFLFPDDKTKSCWTSLIVGYAVVIVTFALQAPVRWSAARLHGAPRLLLADVYHFISFIATVNVWRGVWGLLDIYFFPESPKLSNWSSHIISLTLLILLNCSNSVIVRGVYIDAEEPAGECVVFPCHYLRLFFHKERTKKRHRRALQAAAAAGRKPEDASVPLQIPEEKV
ncbi:hypothetical protein SFRURICE_014051 [Spodoptera frugiperda]|nr:hypothetical protein SFRURICE_014051 [Spodoptera frugiperda]